MEFTIKSKKDGQGWKKAGSLFASSWYDAKLQFTENVRSWMAKEDGIIYLNDEFVSEGNYDNIYYEGSGYYLAEGGWMSPDRLLDSDVIDTFYEDVEKITIRKV